MKGKLNNDKEKLCPFLPKSYFLFLLTVVSSVSKNTCISIFFSINSQYKSFMTRKQQQLGENKKIRLWLTGNSYSRAAWRSGWNRSKFVYLYIWDIPGKDSSMFSLLGNSIMIYGKINFRFFWRLYYTNSTLETFFLSNNA